MAEFLNSEVTRWAIGILVTILVAIASLFVPWFLSRRRKTLWHRENSYPLVESGGADERIEILFDGESVPDVYMSVIGLWYRGTGPMVEDDYRTPVTVDFGEARVLDAEIVNASPEGLPARLSVEDSHRVVFSPVAMNDDNVVRARILLTSRRRPPKVTGHIVDVKIRNVREHRTFPDLLIIAFLGMAGVGLTLAVIGMILGLLLSAPTGQVHSIPAVMLLVGFALLIGGTCLLLPTMYMFTRSLDRIPI
jgi:hypothetical protein